MRERNELMKRITELGFALYDLILFLDTHPEDTRAFAKYEDYQAQYDNARREYVRLYGPLTPFDVHTGRPCSCSDSHNYKSIWSWTEGPMPWEGGCQ